MDDLIRRKDALQAIAQLPLPYGVQRDKIITALYEVPFVDALPVVRCENCAHFTEGMSIGTCKRNPEKPIFPVPFNNYCAFGKRRGKA